MSRSKFGCMVASAVILFAGLIGQAVAAQGGGRMTREEYMAQAAKRMQESLGVTAEEMKALQPKIDKVQTLSRQLNSGMFVGMFGRGGNPPAADPAAVQTPLEKATADLRKLLDNKDSKPEDVKAALEAYRVAYNKVTEELQKAQEELVALLTVQQEARLTVNGVLKILPKK